MTLRVRQAEDVETRWRAAIAAVALYVVANALIWIAVDPETRLTAGADTDTWYRPALALMTHGGFVDLDDPSVVDTYRPPLFPIFAAAAMSVAGGPSPGAVASAQIALLLLVGLLFRDLVRDWMPGWENFGMALLLFNPNALSSAQLVQSETLFLACTTLAFWAAAKYAAGRGRWRFALVAGLAVAFACLTRPTAQFLLPVLPVLFPLLAAIDGLPGVRTALLQGMAAFVLALAVVSPWVYLVASQGHGLALSDSAGKYRYVWDQVVMLEAQSKGLSYHEAEARLTGPGGAEHEFIARRGERWAEMSRPERNRALADAGVATLLSYPVDDFAKTLYRSQAQFFFAGGAGNWHNLFGIGSEALSAAWFAGVQDDLWALLKGLFGDLPVAGLLISAVAIAFAAVARVAGLIGLLAWFGRGRWGLLLIVAGLIAYFALIHVFVGNSRYRVAVEPMLTFLALAGLERLSRLFARR